MKSKKIAPKHQKVQSSKLKVQSYLYLCAMKASKRRMMAEWEPQSMVQLTWPHKDSDWAPILPEITAVYEEMAREISKREGLLIVAPKSLTSNLSPLTSYL